MSLIALARLSIARVRESIAYMDYQWAKQNAPEIAAHKLRALYRAKRARILASARRLPRINADAIVLAVLCIAVPAAIAARWIEVAHG